ncbi:MAM and LDL-receptor class A domain-containing protein 2 [Ixodes scapularis]
MGYCWWRASTTPRRLHEDSCGANANQGYRLALEQPLGPVHAKAAFTGTTSGDPGTAVAVDDIHTDMKPCVPAGNCNFEEDFCNWRNIGPENHMRWYRNSGDTLTRGGPSSDHTLKTAEGIYLVLDAQDLSEVREGALESELLSYGPDVCFRMFYRIASGSEYTPK